MRVLHYCSINVKDFPSAMIRHWFTARSLYIVYLLNIFLLTEAGDSLAPNRFRVL